MKIWLRFPVCLWLCLGFGIQLGYSNPWNGKVVLQAFWWDCENENFPNDWYSYLAKLAPRLRDFGFDGIWLPPPAKANSGRNGMGYDLFDHYDLGSKDQKGTVGTRFGDQDSLLRLIAVAHANGLEVYLDAVLNHCSGGAEDSNAPGNKFKTFKYAGFGGPQIGRWPKSWLDFHPNPEHWCTEGDWCREDFGPDICYRQPCSDPGRGRDIHYMRDKAREWFVWLKKQTGADGFRFDAVKHFPPDVIEDLLFNAMGSQKEYFAVGEFVGSRDQLDSWAAQTQDRCGTFDFSLREALANLVDAGGFFDMAALPNFQQQNRFKTVPFVNNHDTWRGAFWDSNSNGSLKHDDRDGDWRYIPGVELAPTIDPDNVRADVAYAAAFAVDGSPMVYYEDLFKNYGPDRKKANAQTHPVRDYVVNLIWCHQKLNFKDGAYKVRYQGSPDLLVIERSGKALIGLNDHGIATLQAWVQTDFGKQIKLHDYSESNLPEVQTDENGWVKISVPPMSYCVWGPSGVTGGFAPSSRRTTQEFQMDDDLGDSRPNSPGYGGKVVADAYRTGGAVWAAANSRVKVSVYLDTEAGQDVGIRVNKPAVNGEKSKVRGDIDKEGIASKTSPASLEFTAESEGYYQLSAKLTSSGATATRAFIKVEYEAPRALGKF